MRTHRIVMVAAAVVLAVVGCGRNNPAASPTGSTSATPTPLASPTTPAPTGTRTPTPTPTPTKPSPTKPAPTTTRPTTPAPPFPRSLLGQDVERIPTTAKIVALTFDAGANADGVPSILDTLAREHVPATFFLTGDFVTAFPTASRNIAAAGHRIGNHSVDHPYFTDLTDAQIRAELSGAASSIRATTGANPAPLFRFPYGNRDARTIATVNAAGYLAVRWTVDSLGWQGTIEGTRDASFVVQRVVGAATPGEIVAMHVGSNPDDHSTLDAAALPGIIAGLRAKGYTFVTLEALLG